MMCDEACDGGWCGEMACCRDLSASLVCVWFRGPGKRTLKLAKKDRVLFSTSPCEISQQKKKTKKTSIHPPG